MKTINEAAKEHDLCILKNVSNGFAYNIFSFKTGVEFAQRWIPVEEELPEDSMDITRNELYRYTENVIYKTSNNKHGIAYRTEFLDHGFRWSGSGTLQKSITHWRPIELK